MPPATIWRERGGEKEQEKGEQKGNGRMKNGKFNLTIEDNNNKIDLTVKFSYSNQFKLTL